MRAKIRYYLYQYLIARICNDVDNAGDYRILGTDVFYRDELIFTDLSMSLDERGANIDFVCVKPVEYVKMTLKVKVKV